MLLGWLVVCIRGAWEPASAAVKSGSTQALAAEREGMRDGEHACVSMKKRRRLAREREQACGRETERPRRSDGETERYTERRKHKDNIWTRTE